MTKAPSRDLIRLIGFIPMVMLIIAVFDMPYGFYTLLRLVVSVSALLIMWREIASKSNGRLLWLIVMGLTALLFNPLFPVYLTREIWFLIDLAVAALFAVYVVSFPKIALIIRMKEPKEIEFELDAEVFSPTGIAQPCPCRLINNKAGEHD